MKSWKIVCEKIYENDKKFWKEKFVVKKLMNRINKQKNK